MNRVTGQRFHIVILLGSFLCACWFGASPAYSEGRKDAGKRHKFKNVPDVSSTRPGNWQVSEEINIFANGALANTTVDFGFANGWNIGGSLLNTALWQGGSPYQWDPDMLINLEKTFQLSSFWSVIAGSMNGSAPWDPQRKSRVESYSYVDSQWQFPDSGTVIHLGGYIASAGMSGPGDRAGFLAGITAPLGHSAWSFSADYTSGNNALGVATLELLWRVSSGCQFNVGAQLPAPSSPNEFGAMLGFDWRQ